MKHFPTHLFSSALLMATAFSDQSKPNIIDRYKNDPFLLKSQVAELRQPNILGMAIDVRNDWVGHFDSHSHSQL